MNMITSYFNRIRSWAFSPLGLIIISMFAGEYVKPAALVDRFINRVRGY